MKQCTIMFALALVLTLPASARQAEPPTDPDPAIETPPASLDELLGLEADEESARAAEAAARENDEELQRQLEEASLTDAFEIAIEKMTISADLLDRDFDPGLGTQRIQEDILARLEQLLDMARKQQCSGSSGGSSSQPSPSPSPQPNPQAKPGQQQNQQAADSDGQPTDGPPLREGDINTVLEESRTEWGDLPPRVREELLQGRSDPYSNLYEQLTREYYRRLAEEG